MLKSERDDLFMPSSVFGYSSEHFLLRCLQFDQNIAMLTNMLKKEKKKRRRKKHVHNSCGRQHRPIPHNSKCLFSRYMCVLGSADGKGGGKAGAVRICRYKHKEINVHKEKCPAWQWRWKQSPMPSAGLPQEVTVRSHMPSSSQIQWVCYKKWRMEWEVQTGMCRWSTSTFVKSCGCTALDIPEWREMTEQIDWRANG